MARIITRDRGAPSVRADYLRGGGDQEGPILRGRLTLEDRELRFSAPDRPDLSIDLGDMEGLTVSGRSPYEHPRRYVRGTMRVAARSNGTVDVWEFAVARKAGAMLQDRINRELHARRLRRPPLPYVEQLVGPIPPYGEESAANGSNGAPRENLDDDRGKKLSRLRVALLAIVISAIVAAEVLVVLDLLR
jgi:hypothetical protein